MGVTQRPCCPAVGNRLCSKRPPYRNPSCSGRHGLTAGASVLGYVRISTVQQADAGAGLEAQRAGRHRGSHGMRRIRSEDERYRARRTRQCDRQGAGRNRYGRCADADHPHHGAARHALRWVRPSAGAIPACADQAGGRGRDVHPLLEALAWATAINDRLKAEWSASHGGSDEWWDGLPNNDVALALNFARNCVLHDWADALQLDESGVAFPISFPMTFHEWRWRAGLTPRKPDRAGQAAYDSTLAGVPARHTLDSVRALFSAGAVRL